MFQRLLVPVLFVCSIAHAQAPAGYYDTASGLKGASLKSALNDIIKGHTSYPYTDSGTDVWDILKETDKDPNNSSNVILLYTGWSVNAAQEYNNAAGWTREHVWAKSRGILYDGYGAEDDVAATDIHHLKPADVGVNSARNNRWFDYCTIPYFSDGVNTGSFTSTEAEWVWQPRDEVMGDVARMMFYMATRYEGEEGEPDLELIDEIPADRYTNEPVFAKLSTLLAWHAIDPVDESEQNRNNVIYSFQGNRNPFIDHPDWVDSIFTINEVNNTSVEFKVPGSMVQEDVGSVDIEVVIKNPDSNNPTSCEIVLTSSTGSLDDIESYTTQTIIFPAGTGLNQRLNIRVTDDEIAESGEQFTFGLQNVTGGNAATVGDLNTYTLTISASDLGLPSIVINEIMNNPSAVADADGEWFELYNSGDTSVNLQNWTIRDTDNDSFIIDQPLTISPHDYLVFGNNQNVETNGGAEIDYTFSSFYLSNSGDELLLINERGQVVDSVAWDGGPQFPDLDGASMALNEPEENNSLGENWKASSLPFGLGDFGSPGGSNFIIALISTDPGIIPDDYTLVQNYPNPFNPYTSISYDLPEQSAVSLTVFDVRGQEIKTLEQSEKSPGSHEITWNGLDQSGNPVSTGVYFCHLQIGTPNSGGVRFSKTIKMLMIK
ncbi:MAG: endonuclease [Candidatus Marinimicrobia bacterium]|nr:endonuclease [Candidatus Neomarinimicrobiota bacterium]